MSNNNNNISPRSMDELDDIELTQPSSQRRAKRCSTLCKYAKPVSVAIVVSTFVVALIVIIAASTDGPSYSSSANNNSNSNSYGNYGSPSVDGTLGGGSGGYTADDHNTWDNKDWYELTPAEKSAAETLGKFFLRYLVHIIYLVCV